MASISPDLPISHAAPRRWGNLAYWTSILGPGAIIASLTIGSGELIFSTRAGALFGYDILWFFLLIVLAKWVLVFSSARQMVLSGYHPFELWSRLPGPMGWLPLTFLLLAVPCFPVWVAFHAGTVGTLLSHLGGFSGVESEANPYLWGMLVLGGIYIAVLKGGYTALERIQFAVVVFLLAAIGVSLLMLQPSLIQVLKGLLLPSGVSYPGWIGRYPEFAGRPVWLETITYVGVIGGSSYDYLVYVSYLRQKRWGQAGRRPLDPKELAAVAADPRHPNRRSLRAPLLDCGVSFLLVGLFSLVFVVCGHLVLGPQGKLPAGNDLLSLQADFVTPLYPRLRYLYFAGAMVAMLGTLYGTIEVAPAVFHETVGACGMRRLSKRAVRIYSLIWVGVGAFGILIGLFAGAQFRWGDRALHLVAILTPANLFTGVMGCGIFCWLNLWADARFLPKALRMGWILAGANLIAGAGFVALGIKGYWDHSGFSALGILLVTAMIGWAWAARMARRDR